MDQKLQRVAARPEADWDGDDDLDQLYRRHASWLGAMLRKRYGRAFEADADDVVQETYARLAPHPAQEIQKPRALLMRVASNLARDLLRRRAVRGRHAQGERAAVDQSPPLSDQFSDLAIKETILSIPDAYRDVFILSRFQGLTYEEIATRCGLSVKSVEWRLKQAIAHCVKRVQD